METEYFDIAQRVLAALVAGGIIGFERNFHGRPAGFRTHILVATSSALLMLVTVYQWRLLETAPIDTLRVDPTRMAQGIMTGIGFLGAGVIVKEGLSVRGLTTAASIWMTASIGILLGLGFYFAGALGTGLAVGTLSLFRWIEDKTPALHYARLAVRFVRQEALSESALKELVVQHGMSAAHARYHLEDAGQYFSYELTIRTYDPTNFERLASALQTVPGVAEFHIQPTGD